MYFDNISTWDKILRFRSSSCACSVCASCNFCKIKEQVQLLTRNVYQLCWNMVSGTITYLFT